jgi:hypothetical protein
MEAMKEDTLQELEDLLENNKKLLPVLKDRYNEDVRRVKKDIRAIEKEINEYKDPKTANLRSYVTRGYVHDGDILFAYEQLVSKYGEGVTFADLLRQVNKVSAYRSCVISYSALSMRLYSWNNYTHQYVYKKTGSGWGKVLHAFIPVK